MLHVLWLLPGFLFGAAEFFLTRSIVRRVTDGHPIALRVVLKILSYAAVLLPVFFLLPQKHALWFGIGAGAGLPIVGVVVCVRDLKREKR